MIGTAAHLNSIIRGIRHFDMLKKDVNPSFGKSYHRKLCRRIIPSCRGQSKSIRTAVLGEDNNENYVYGNLNDIREKSYGFESRCFSSWVSSPAIRHAFVFEQGCNE